MNPGAKAPGPPQFQVTIDAPQNARGVDKTAAAVESGYKSAFAAAVLPASQAHIDKIEEKLGVPLNAADDAYEKLNTFYNANAAAIGSAGSALASAVNLDVKSIENTINRFAETSDVLMKGLDALGAVHPFVGVAVMAFKLVITLDITRRQNNKKVLAVKIQMQDMMTVLFQLRHMRDPEEKGPDGTTLKDRMSSLMQAIANDITACGSACDMYMKKSFLAKTIKSKIYESRLTGYVTMFDNHKKEVGFALKVHTALGVDAANRKLDGQEGHLQAIEDKMEALFRKLDTPKEREVTKFIDEKGGARACVESEAALEELMSKSGEAAGDLAGAKKMLNKELAEDVDEAFRKNMQLFDRKLEMQERQLEDAISLAGEHIITVLTGGAHEKILDPELQALWKDQGWKGSVKARHFVLALNDYYTDKFSTKDIVAIAESVANSVAGSAPPSPILSPVQADGATAPHDDDRWALAYINVARLQPILEAVDDDGTGFVSIKEANDFALRRPKGWSLLSWVAYWAAGWHLSVTWYKNRIYNIVYAMMRLLRRVKRANIQSADAYFGGAEMQRVEKLLRSTRSDGPEGYADAALKRIVDAFQKQEEERLEKRLASMFYELDDVATMRLITGPRRIERYVYPLLYRLLQRHFDILRLACVHVLNESEFDTMTTSLATVFKVFDERTNNLAAILKSNSSDVKERLGNFAFGMFQLSYGEQKREPKNNTVYSFDEEDGFEDSTEDLGPGMDDDEPTAKATLARVPLTILRFETQNEPRDVYDFELQHPPPAPSADGNPLEGAWTGHLHDSDGMTFEGIMSLVITSAAGNAEKVAGKVECLMDLLDVEGTIAAAEAGAPAEAGAGAGKRKVVLDVKWPDGFTAECTGEYDPATDTIKGEWHVKADADSDSDSDSESSGSGSDSDSDSKSDSDSDSDSDNSNSESDSDSESGGKAEKDKSTGEASKTDGPVVAMSESEDDMRFVFCRTPADAYRFRYTDAAFTANRAQARWKFAIAAAIDEVQRTRLSWPYLKKRFEERRRLVELQKRKKMNNWDLAPRTPLSPEEIKELWHLKRVIRPCDARFYDSVAELHVNSLVAYKRTCDSCRRSIRGTRFFCFECTDDQYSNTIDLCSDCVDQTPQRGDTVHGHNHLLVKTNYRIHDGDIAWMMPEVKVVAERVKKAFRDAHSLLARIEGTSKQGRHGSKGKSKAKQICCCCGEPVSPPCWVCLLCNTDSYICMACDAKGAKALPDGANPEHSLSDPLIRIVDTEPIPEPMTTEARLTELETRMSELDSKIATLEGKLDSRFASLEALLQSIGEKLSVKS